MQYNLLNIWNKHIRFSCRWVGWCTSTNNSEVVKNERSWPLVAFAGYHVHFRFCWVFPRAFGFLLVEGGFYDTLNIALKHFVKQHFIRIAKYVKQYRDSWFKMSTICRKNNSDSNIPKSSVVLCFWIFFKIKTITKD